MGLGLRDEIETQIQMTEKLSEGRDGRQCRQLTVSGRVAQLPVL